MICPRLELLEGPMAVGAASGLAGWGRGVAMWRCGDVVRLSSRKEPAATGAHNVQVRNVQAKERCKGPLKKDANVGCAAPRRRGAVRHSGDYQATRGHMCVWLNR